MTAERTTRMALDRTDLMRQIDTGTTRLLDTVARLSDDDVRQASLLPGWTRGHVLTHVARTGDALRNLLIWARTGVETPGYPSQEARDAAIEAGSGRGVAELRSDIRASATAFTAEVRAMPDTAWQYEVRVLHYNPFPAEQALVRRLVEVELHHTDLGCGYTSSDWPTSFATMDLDEPMNTQRHDRTRW